MPSNPPVKEIEPLAIVGIGCRFPGGVHDPDSFWQLLCQSRSAISEIPKDRWNGERYYSPDIGARGKLVTRWGGFVDQLDEFDAGFFSITPREAARMDPQQRWLLELAWEALEDALCPPSSLRGTATGVFVGASSSDYGKIQQSFIECIDGYSNSGNTLSIASNRISYQFDLRGPSLTVDTACSSSLVAVDLACKHIWSGQCSSALVGGSNALILPDGSMGFSKASMLSPTGKCFAFDSRADGYVRSEGAGIIYIKPLKQAIEDGNKLYAVIRSTAVNQDGKTSSMTVPAIEAQRAMLEDALAAANIQPEQVTYVEAHGTGTPVGDPIEARALGEALSRRRQAGSECLIGSVKTNLGHLEPAAGIAGIIKAALILKNGKIPPSLNFSSPNPNIPFEALKLKVVTVTTTLPEPACGNPVVAVNSFGFGGTNAHTLLEGAPAPPPPATPLRSTPAKRSLALPISARCPSALHELAVRYLTLLADDGSATAEICAAAATLKDHHDLRLVALGQDRNELESSLQHWLDDSSFSDTVVSGRTLTGKVSGPVFVFTGQGAQWWAMGRQLLEREPLFVKTLAEIESILKPLASWSLTEELLRPEKDSLIHRTEIAQPALFALQISLVAIWRSWGVNPTLVMGHSVGEVAAACTAGIYSLREATELVFHRSRLQATTGGTGRMVAVGISQEDAKKRAEIYEGKVEVAVINAPALVTLAGDTEPLIELTETLADEGKFVRWLPIDYAFHTHQMDPIKADLLDALSGISPRESTIPFLSTVHAEIFPGESLDPEYWWRNVRNPVQFAPAVESLLEAGENLFLEIGPHPSLQSSLRDCLTAKGTSGCVVHSLNRNSDDSVEMTKNFAALHVAGAPINWESFLQAPAGRKVCLPAYPWQRKRFWIESPSHHKLRTGTAAHPLLGMRTGDPDPCWELLLDPRSFPYLEDHQFWNRIVFPVAGFAEIGLAIGRELNPDSPMAVEDLVVQRILFLSKEDLSTLRVEFAKEDSRFRIFSKHTDNESWNLHGTGRLVPESGNRGRKIDLNHIRNKLSLHSSHWDYYENYSKAGYEFGPDFRQIQKVCYGDNESLAEVVTPPNLEKETNDYHFHPAVLDACFQSIRAATSRELTREDEGYLYLPSEIQHLHLWVENPPRKFWVHAVVTKQSASRIDCDLDVCDASGGPIATLRGFQLTPVRNSLVQRENEDCLYQLNWERFPLKGADLRGSCNFPSPSKTAVSIRESGDDECFSFDGNCWKDLRPALDELALQSVRSSYCKLGWNFNIGDRFTLTGLREKLTIPELREPLVRAQLRALEDDNWIKAASGGAWKVKRSFDPISSAASFAATAKAFPSFQNLLSLQQHAADHLPLFLSGNSGTNDSSPAEISPDFQDQMIAASPEFQGYFEKTSQVVQLAIRDLPERRTLRVLELNGAKGNLAAKLLPFMPPDRTEYLFTDPNEQSIQIAETTLSSFPFVEYLTLESVADIDNCRPFDLILGLGSLSGGAHLSQLARCLSPEGLMILSKKVGSSIAVQNSVGLSTQWWDPINQEPEETLSRRKASSAEQDLKGAGLTEVEKIPVFNDFTDSGPSLYLARKVSEENPEMIQDPAPNKEQKDPILLLGDRGGVSDAIAMELAIQGHPVVRVNSGEAFTEIQNNHFVINPSNLGQLDPILDRLENGGKNRVTITHLWCLDHPEDADLDAQALRAAQNSGVFSCHSIAQLLAKREMGARVCFVSRSVSQGGEEGISRLASAPLSGFLRVAIGEHPETDWSLILLDAENRSREIQDLVDELTFNDQETEIAYIKGLRYSRRLQRVKSDELKPRTASILSPDGSLSPYRIESERKGTLDRLVLNKTFRRRLLPDEIEVRVAAAGINFRDLMKALAMYPGEGEELDHYGDDFAGTVIAVGNKVTEFHPGDEVVGLTDYCFQSHVAANRHLAFRKPEGISFAEGATLPTVFLTAHYAIHHLAQLQPGESILIHAATGGVGLAAIQVAKDLGLEIFATAGTEEKRQLLRDMGITRVMDSRSLDFAREILRETDGRGVDAVLNSLAGEFINKSLSVLAPFGRFLEIGKVDIYANRKLGMQALRNNISYFVVDMAQLLQARPRAAAVLLDDLRKRFETGIYRPLPHKVFSAAGIADAFREMARGKHVGKLVLDFSRDDVSAGLTTSEGRRFRDDVSYVISGGANGFGFEVAKWLAENGAKHLVLLTRSGPGSADVASDIEKLRSAGVHVRDERVDICDGPAVTASIRKVEADMPPVGGVFHAAMVLDDRSITELDRPAFETAFNPKIYGAWNLHASTTHRKLDFFVCFSSFSAVIGSFRQANYNAGNTFLDEIARYRQSLGLPSLSINWGALAGAGFVERNETTRSYLGMIGLDPFTVKETLHILGELLSRNVSTMTAARVDWTSLVHLAPAIAKVPLYSPVVQTLRQGVASGSMRPMILAAPADQQVKLVEDFIADQIAAVFATDSNSLDRKLPVTSLGLDSLMAIELLNRVESELGTQFPVGSILNGPSIEQLAIPLLEALLASDVNDSRPPEEGDSTKTDEMGQEEILPNLASSSKTSREAHEEIAPAVESH